MTTLNAELYDALLAINVPEAKARAAASAAINAIDGRFNAIDVRFNAIENRLVRIEAELSFHRWAFAAIVGLQIAILAKLFLTSSP